MLFGTDSPTVVPSACATANDGVNTMTCRESTSTHRTILRVSPSKCDLGAVKFVFITQHSEKPTAVYLLPLRLK